MNDPQASFSRIIFFPLSSRGGAVFLTFCTGLLTLALSLGPIGRKDARLYLFAAAAIVAASYLYRVTEETVTGSERAPGIQVEDWDEAGLDLMRYLGGLLVAFLPISCLLLYALMEQGEHLEKRDFQAALGICFLLGTAYLPMALLLNGFTQRFGTAFNLGVGLRGIRTMGADYAFVCIYFLTGNAAWCLLYGYWVGQTPAGINSARLTASAVTSCFALYVSVLQMRALGKMYRKHHDALGWTLGQDA